MRIALLGSQGQLGWELQRSLAPLGTVVALHRDSQPQAADLQQPDALADTLRALAPQVIVNAAAYTAVDRAESEPDAAHAVNATAVGVLAETARELGAWLIHYSTDYVFDGSGSRPWREDDPTGPLNVYGASKLQGERLLAASGARHLILRTSWVFETWGQNFIRTMLRLGRERDRLRVVADQWGAPTRAALIADVSAHLLRRLATASDADRLAGTYHLAAAGETSWHGYARLVFEEALACGATLRIAPSAVEAIASGEYPTPARRPANSRLDCSRLQKTFGLTLPPWQDGVRAVVRELMALTPPSAS